MATKKWYLGVAGAAILALGVVVLPQQILKLEGAVTDLMRPQRISLGEKIPAPHVPGVEGENAKAGDNDGINLGGPTFAGQSLDPQVDLLDRQHSPGLQGHLLPMPGDEANLGRNWSGG